MLLVTSASLRDAEWPRESLDDIFYIQDDKKRWKLDDLILGASHLARRVAIDRIVPLDDFDLEKASALREHLRVPGMGETTTRYFRDKLAMRVKAQDDGLPVPAFVHVLNDDAIREFCRRVPPPWFLKPRHQAGAIGIRKINGEDELWAVTDALGDERSYFLLEEFVPGDVYHVDSIVYEREVLAAVPSRYGTPPFDVSHSGGVFTTRLLDARRATRPRRSCALNARLLASLGLVRGVSHSEYIRGARRPAGVSRDLGARRRRAHRRARRSGDRRQHVGGVGEDRSRRRQGAVCGAADAPRLRRAARLAGAAGIARPQRLTPIPKWSGGCESRITPG